MLDNERDFEQFVKTGDFNDLSRFQMAKINFQRDDASL